MLDFAKKNKIIIIIKLKIKKINFFCGKNGKIHCKKNGMEFSFKYDPKLLDSRIFLSF
jgi:hypothetical protein